jgi:hypothetical protein
MMAAIVIETDGGKPMRLEALESPGRMQRQPSNAAETTRAPLSHISEEPLADLVRLAEGLPTEDPFGAID